MRIMRSIMFCLAIILLIPFGFVSGSQSGFADPALEAAVLAVSENLNEITSLDLANSEIKSLMGIEQLVNLKSLNLRETEVTDLTPIAGLTKLEYLNLHSTKVTSLAPINGLINLETLIMRNVYLGNDLEFLANLTKLTRLNIRNTGLADTTVLGDLMAKGALQDNPDAGIRAVLDLRDNPLRSDRSTDDYAPLRGYWDNIAASDPENLPAIAAQNVMINEFMASNQSTAQDRFFEFPDWIELYNPQGEAIDLTGYFLSDSMSNPFKWQFPAGTKIAANGFLLVYASGRDEVNRGQIHTNFSLAKEGEALLLTDSDGVLQDFIPPLKQERDISYGRFPDGSDQLVFMATPSPGKTNNAARTYQYQLQAPQFSHLRGFYQEPFSLDLTSVDSDATIYYTLDGSTPTQDSLVYQQPIAIGPENYKTDLLAYIKTIGSFNVNQIERDRTGIIQREAFLPWTPKNVFQGIVVRAVAYQDGLLASDVVTHTYFIDEDIFNRYSLPIISISTDPAGFFDHRTGIYVAGIHYFNMRPGRPWHNPGNYTQRGIEWERPAHVEFFEPGGEFGFNLNVGARVHGGITRAWPQKTLRFHARSAYDSPGVIEYEIFPGLTKNGTGETLTEFKRILLRNAGNHWSVDLFADALMHELISHTRVDVQAYRPAIIFLNGEYWGIQNIRERLDQHYLATNYDLDPNNVVITTHYDELDYGNPGDERDLHQIVEFVQRNNMASSRNYDYITTKIDIDTYLDYQVAQIFYSNTDWPGKNTAVWRLKTEEYQPDAPYGHDGRWRWMMYDTDFGFGYVHGTDGDFNSLEHATGSRGPLLRNLLDNRTFRDQFINRFADHLNSSFTLERLITMIDQIEATLKPEIAEHIERWGNPGGSVERWLENVEAMRIWATNRHQYIWSMIQNFFRIGDPIAISLKTDLAGGFIQINSLEIVAETPGVIDPADWSGIYFSGIPVTITAIPKDGYEFVGWEGSVSSRNAQINITPSQDINLTALFQVSDN